MLCSIHSHSHPKLLLTGFVLTGAIAPALAQSVLTQHGETVIASGDAVPGFPTGAVIAPGFTALGAAIDRNGTMVFRARVTQNAALGIDSTNDGALFVGRNLGDLRLCVRAGDQAPGCAAGTLLRSNLAAASNGLGTNPRISPTGEILFFRSAIYDPTTPANTPSNANTALFWGTVGNLQLLAREGDTVPFLGNGERYGDIVFTHQSNKINSSGAVVLHNILQTGGGVNSSNDSMLVTGLPGNLQLIVREGSVWPGSQNSELTGPVTTLAQLNESGAVLHEVQLALGSGTVPVTAANDRLLAMWVAGTDLTLCREGDQAPGLPTGVVFADASPTQSFVGTSACSWNASGQTVVRVHLAGGGTTAGVDDTALYLAGPGALSKVFRRGEAAPGLPAGVTFGAVTDDSIGIDDSGRILCTTSLGGSVTTGDDSAVWFGTPNNLQPLAREGDLAPLTPSTNGPWRFDELFGNVRPVVNGRGQVIMPAQVTDGVASRVAWFGYRTDGRTQVLVDGTESWTTPLGTSAIQTLQFISAAGGGDSSPSWFNDQGDLTLVATLQTTPVNHGNAIVRMHLGSMQANPAAIPATGGSQSWSLDAGGAQAFQLYFVLGTQSGTRPGLPFGGAVIPLVPDPWFSATLSAANSSVYTNSLGLLDGQGRAVASFNFPPGFASYAGTLFHHAFVVLDSNLQLPFVSEPTAVKLF